MNLLSLIPGPGGSPSLRRSALAWLMHLANQSRCQRFFEVKSAVLRSHGEPDGYDLQTVERECWDCDGRGCHRCVNGIYSRGWNALHRYQIEGWTFHIPEKLWSKCTFVNLQPGARSLILGTKHYDHANARIANEAQLWFLLLFRPTSFRSKCRAMCYAQLNQLPLSLVQFCIFHCHINRYWFHNLRVSISHALLKAAFRLCTRIYPRTSYMFARGTNRATFKTMEARQLIDAWGNPDRRDVPF